MPLGCQVKENPREVDRGCRKNSQYLKLRPASVQVVRYKVVVLKISINQTRLCIRKDHTFQWKVLTH